MFVLGGNLDLREKIRSSVGGLEFAHVRVLKILKGVAKTSISAKMRYEDINYLNGFSQPSARAAPHTAMKSGLISKDANTAKRQHYHNGDA